MAYYKCNQCNTHFNDELSVFRYNDACNAAILCGKCGNYIANGQCREAQAYCVRCGDSVPVVYACPECWSVDIEVLREDNEYDSLNDDLEEDVLCDNDDSVYDDIDD